MSIISLSTYVDMSGAATPSSGIIMGLDISDGKLKQKGTSGVVTEIGSGAGSGSAGTSGSSGTRGSSGTSGVAGLTGPSGADGGNSLKWIYGDKDTTGEFELTTADFTQTNNYVLINYSSQIGDVSSWLTALGDYATLFSGAVYMKISELVDPNIYGIYQVTAGSDQTTHWRYEVTKVSSNGTPTNSLEYSISWVIMGGNSGSSGTSGSSGSSGTRGSSGTSGSSGSSGTSGSAGTSGSSGSSGVSGGVIIVNSPITSPVGFTLNPLPTPSLEFEYWPVDTTSSSISFTLGSVTSLADGKTIIIKDEAGSAGANGITINAHPSETIDGLSSKSIDSAYGSLTLIKNGGGSWFVVSKIV
jgi:hypothetical protein